MQETKRLLRQLPYRYKFRSVVKPEGAEAAVGGRVVGRHRTTVNFGIALGRGHYGVPVPRAGTRYSPVSQAVGSRGFREGGGMPTVSLEESSGRYLSFAEREEIALLRAGGCGVREISRRLSRSPSTVSRSRLELLEFALERRKEAD